MTRAALQTAIRNLEGKIKVAKDHATFHRQRADQYERDVIKYQTAIDAIHEVVGGHVDVAGADGSGIADESPFTAAEVFDDVEEAPAEPSHPLSG